MKLMFHLVLLKVLGKNVGVPEQPIRLKMHDDHSLDTFILENMNKMSYVVHAVSDYKKR